MTQQMESPMCLDLYLRQEDEILCGMMHNLTLDIWAYIADLNYLLLYIYTLLFEGSTQDELQRGFVQVPAAFARVPTEDVKKLAIEVTGNAHNNLHGQVSCSGGDFERTKSFDSSLELLHWIYQWVRF